MKVMSMLIMWNLIAAFMVAVYLPLNTMTMALGAINLGMAMWQARMMWVYATMTKENP